MEVLLALLLVLVIAAIVLAVLLVAARVNRFERAFADHTRRMQQHLMRQDEELADARRRLSSLEAGETAQPQTESADASPTEAQTRESQVDAPQPKPDEPKDNAIDALRRVRASNQQQSGAAAESNAESGADLEPAADIDSEQDAQRVGEPQGEDVSAVTEDASAQTKDQPATVRPAMDRAAMQASANDDAVVRSGTHHAARELDAPAAKSKLSLEEVLAGRVFVWIGAVSLVLTAAFLLKIGFERDIITEPVRVIAAGLFGLALIGVGEWTRRRAELIGQVLSGAAVAVLYASVLAAHGLYDLLGSSGGQWAFGLMAVITAGAIGLSLRHGPIVALIGMLGGFMLPPVLGEDFTVPTGGMVLYLLALEVGLLAVTRQRGWFGIGLLTLVFTTVWSLGYALIGESPKQRTFTALLVMGTAVAYLVQTARVYHRAEASSQDKTQARRALGLAIGSVCSAAAIVGLLVPRGGYAAQDLWMLGLIAAGVMTLARLDRRFRALPPAAMALVLLILLAGVGSLWAGVAQASTSTMINTITWASVGYGLLFGLGGYACAWGEAAGSGQSTWWRARLSLEVWDRRLFTLVSVLAGPSFLGMVILAHWRALDWREPWWPWSLGLAGVYAAMAWPMLYRRGSGYDWSVSGYALGSFGMVCAAIGQGLDHPRVAVCLALTSAAAALVDRRLFIRPLLLAGCGVGALSAVLVVVPGPFEMTIERWWVLNNLMPTYALVALGLGILAWCARQAGEARLERAMTWLTCGAAAALPVVLIRDWFFPANFSAEQFALYEWAWYALALMGSAMVAQYVARRWSLAAVAESAVLLAGVGAAVGLIGGLSVGNPLLRSATQGGVALGFGLVFLYAVPGALMAYWARQRELLAWPGLGVTLHRMSWAMIVLLVGLEVRNAFRAADLHEMSVGMFECATLAVAWLMLGVAMKSWVALGLSDGARHALLPIARVVIGLGLVVAMLGNVVVLNPLWNQGSVGTWPVLNGVWYLILPSLLTLAVLSMRARQRGLVTEARVCGLLAVAIGLLLVSLLVRQGFSGDGVLALNRGIGESESYTYSLVWVLFGSGLLLAGLWTKLDTLRYGSLAVLLLAVGKVFLIDTQSLENLYRVMSFFGLGVTLIGLGYVYQRLVFRPAKSGGPGEAEPSDQKADPNAS